LKRLIITSNQIETKTSFVHLDNKVFCIAFIT